MGDSVRQSRYNLVRSDSHALTGVRTPFLIHCDAKYRFLRLTPTLGGFEPVLSKIEFLPRWNRTSGFTTFSTAAFIANQESPIARSTRPGQGAAICPRLSRMLL